jgi:GntR family transcriptional repressor for pyruvate dehydrogenase complex
LYDFAGIKLDWFTSKKDFMKKKLKYAPLKKKRLYEEVADQLKKTIFKGDLEPGDQLPPERELSEMFNVGRPTIREALRTLSVLGLIDSNPGFKGSVVKKINLSQYLDAMSDQFAWMIQADEQSFEQMSEARKYIELGIAHAVAQQADEKDFAELEQDLDELETVVNDPKKYLQGAVAFHFKLARMSNNRIYHMIWKLFYDICVKEASIMKGMYDPVLRLLEANRVMLDAIKSRDPDKIDKAMKFHAEVELPIDRNV